MTGPVPYAEGKAVIKYRAGAFLNPVAAAMRDIDTALISTFATRDTAVLDATAGTGIRGIRYYLETEAKRITMLDINASAARAARLNAAHNGIKASILNRSIQEFTGSHKSGKFDVVDFDPFGSVSSGIYDLMKVSKDGTMMLFTATDTAVLSGAHHKACIKIYDSRPMHNELCHEVGLRILIGYVLRNAAQFNFGVEVVLSLSYAHYMRAAVRLRHGAETTMASIGQMGYAYYCRKCGFRSVVRSMFPVYHSKCPGCGSEGALDIAGKLWAGSLHEKEAVSATLGRLLDRGSSKGAIKLLSTISEELDVPLYYSVPHLTKDAGLPAMSPNVLIARLRKAGSSATHTHFDPSSIKTDADIRTINAQIRAARARG